VKSKTIEASIIRATKIFISIFTVLLGLQSYFEARGMITDEYRTRLRSVVTNFSRSVDAEELKESLSSGILTEKCVKWQQLAGDVLKDFELESFYICLPASELPADGYAAEDVDAAGNEGLAENAGAAGNGGPAEDVDAAGNEGLAEGVGAGGNEDLAEGVDAAENGGSAENAGAAEHAGAAENAGLAENAHVADNANLAENEGPAYGRTENAMLFVVTSGLRATGGRKDSTGTYHVLEVDDYARSELEAYKKAAASSDATSFFYRKVNGRKIYTACLPLTDADGRVAALCCAELDVGTIQTEVAFYVFRTMLLTVIVCGACGLLLCRWLNKNVVIPVTKLEESARYFAMKCHAQKDPENLVYFAPEIKTRNELQNLASSIEKMTGDMRNYVKNVYDAEMSARLAHREAEHMSRLAHEDPLTHVKSKTAYEEKKLELAKTIAEKETRFAIVMVDLNHLKKVNDTYGHENGNTYITGACGIIRDVFGAASVYRVGGDEFVVILEGEEYGRREELMRQLEEKFEKASSKECAEPWERYSAAFGMQEYSGGEDEDVDAVYRKADEKMYACKQRMKAGRDS
jgi:diguanylate cyclase (GGDEF)-like protein